ncbi:hypothetical protein HK103_004947 [Boothiomyces macroporosus]|uniref:Uncharacterized protein n=1 Tax=Boothiomyces macroporosus TaxID=261099 RepID=A0AAD5UGI8_9FUNG|nr:hypothetical protein HK103_004947 [Boothiomyces macroporosus]
MIESPTSDWKYPDWVAELPDLNPLGRLPDVHFGYLSFIRSFDVKTNNADGGKPSQYYFSILNDRSVQQKCEFARFLLDSISPSQIPHLFSTIHADPYNVVELAIVFLKELFENDSVTVKIRNNFISLLQHYLSGDEMGVKKLTKLTLNLDNPILAFWISLTCTKVDSSDLQTALKCLELSKICMPLYSYLGSKCKFRIADYLMKETGSTEYIVAKYIQAASIENFEEYIKKLEEALNLEVSMDVTLSYMIWLEFANWKQSNLVDSLDKILQFYVKLQNLELQFCIGCIFQSGVKSQILDHIDMIEKLHGKPKEPVNQRFTRLSKIFRPLMQFHEVRPAEVVEAVSGQKSPTYFDAFFGDMMMMLPKHIALSRNAVIDYIGMLYILKFTYINDLPLVHPKRYFPSMSLFEASSICETTNGEFLPPE